MTDIVIEDDRGNGRLEARSDGQVVGRIEYFELDRPEGGLVPVHTVVEPDHEGKGIAGSLARELYAVAERDGVVVVPLCPYVVRWAERHPQEAPAVDDELVRTAKRQLAADPDRW
ncbi:N-acetyltransferase [Streptomyces triticagri]|uniref:N-acetyltransferase n=1 Tax=Streptomyces triticagri TaxID=2293568 RepID=A0A372M599_9ACTN|nr:GNAT family N-acetyltransferase [Streptomyces triticagri]RFU85477.1 N-acetyltransferase [Streptomyces triticagri]